jgi:menaquinone-dependent protoporphyrinogen oxidase
MTILIVYSTVEGQTRKIARFVEQLAGQNGYEVATLDADDKAVTAAFDTVEKVILAAPVHERRHPKAFEAFLTAHRHQLEARGTMLISVSLNAAFPEGLGDAEEYVTELKMRTGFAPGTEALVAGAVRTLSYDYFATQVVRHVVLRDRAYDPDQGEHEFTDWTALEASVTGFLAAEDHSE